MTSNQDSFSYTILQIYLIWVWIDLDADGNLILIANRTDIST